MRDVFVGLGLYSQLATPLSVIASPHLYNYNTINLSSYQVENIFGKIGGVINFNEYNYANNIKLTAYDRDENVIIDNVEQIYNTYYSISDDENIKYADRYSDFLNNLKKMNVEFVGDEFYK